MDRGFNPILPFRDGFKNLVLKLIARLNNWFISGYLSYYSLSSLFALFPLFVFSPVLNSIDQGLRSIVFVTQSKNKSTISFFFVLAKRIKFPYQ